MTMEVLKTIYKEGTTIHCYWQWRFRIHQDQQFTIL